MTVNFVLVASPEYFKQLLCLLKQFKEYSHYFNLNVYVFSINYSLSTREKSFLLFFPFVEYLGAISLPSNIKPSAAKTFIPVEYLDVNYCFLIDTDTLILDSSFFHILYKVNPNKISSVLEEDIKWTNLSVFNMEIKRELLFLYSELLNCRIFQTGLIGFNPKKHKNLFYEIRYLIKKQKYYKGDMIAWNKIFWDLIMDINKLSERVHLVLRSNLKGPSSRAHVKHLTVRNNTIKFKHKKVCSIHYTNSKGKIYGVSDFLEALCGI